MGAQENAVCKGYRRQERKKARSWSSKRVGSGRNGGKLHKNYVLSFAIEKGLKGGR